MRKRVSVRVNPAAKRIKLLSRKGSLLLGIAATLCSVFFSGAESARTQKESSSGGSAKVDWSVFLPDGEGKSDVAISCSSCHDLKQVIIQKKSRANWAATVQKMVSAYQAPLDKDDFPGLIAYLAKNFGEDNPIDQLPIDVNKCSAAALSRLPEIGPELAKAVVEDRKARGEFASIDDLLRVKGMNVGKLYKIKMYIKTND